jgi:putative transposase
MGARHAPLVAGIRRVWNPNLRVYRGDNVWKQLSCEGIRVPRCTVERLTPTNELGGATRAKRGRTTLPDAEAVCPLDRVNRYFKANRPNQLSVLDFNYVFSPP